MQDDYANYEAEGMEYPPSDREIPTTTQHVKPNTIMKPTISQKIKAIRPPKTLKENLSKPMNSLQSKKEKPQQVQISLKNYVKTSPKALKTSTFVAQNQYFPQNPAKNASSNNFSTQFLSSFTNNTNNPSNFANVAAFGSEIMSDPLKLYQEYQSLFQILQQTSAKCGKLEESLRNETINSEEQRSYIAILKQALEEKLITNELWTNCQGNEESPQYSPVDYYVECRKLKDLLERKDQEINEIVESFEENKRILEKTLGRNEELQGENAKNCEEKDSLLEYLDEIKTNFMRIEQQNQQYEALISAISQEKDEMKGYYEDLKRQFEEKLEENARIVEELQSEKALSQEIESHRQKLLVKSEELVKELNELKSHDYKADFHAVSQEKANLVEKLRISNENFLTVKSTLQETQSDLDKALEKIKEFNEEIGLYRDLKEKHEALEIKHFSLEEEFEALAQSKREEIVRMENDRLKKTEEIKGIYQQLSQNRSESRLLKDELAKTQSEKELFEQEIDNLQQKVESQRNRMGSYEAEINEYKKIIEERDLSSAKLHTLSIKYQADKEFFEDSLKELRRKNAEISQENEELLKEIKQNREKALKFEEKAMKFEENTAIFSGISMEQAFKYVNSMTMDLKRYLGNTKLTRNSEKFDLESSLLELHELVIMCLEKLEETSSSSLAKRQNLQEKDEEIRSLQEKLETSEQNFQRNLELLEKEKEEIAMRKDCENKEILQELRRQEENRWKSLQEELRLDGERARESLNKLRKEKNCHEFLLRKFKALINDDDTKRIFEELVAINFEILDQELRKTDLQVKLDQLTKQKSKEGFYELNNLKENLYENQKCLEKFYEKKLALENDLQKIDLVDRRKVETKGKKLAKTNSESNLRAIFEETRGTDVSIASNTHFESKVSSIKDEKPANKPQIYRDFSSSKYVSYQDKFDKSSLYEKNAGAGQEVNPIYNNLNELRSKFSKKSWKFDNMY